MKWLTICAICLSLLLGACRNADDGSAVATVEPIDESNTKDAADAVSEETSLQESDDSFEDTNALMLGRLILIDHLLQVEGITAVPLPDTWQPDRKWEDDTQRTFLFNSAEWQLQMVQPKENAGSVLYFAELKGPDNFLYAAEIHREGLVYPAQ